MLIKTTAIASIPNQSYGSNTYMLTGASQVGLVKIAQLQYALRDTLIQFVKNVQLLPGEKDVIDVQMVECVWHLISVNATKAGKGLIAKLQFVKQKSQ